MTLTRLDWIIITLTLVASFVPALFMARRAGSSLAQFFVSGRSLPWWLAGLSMVATTFSTGTPNLVTDIVRRQGVAGNWVWWAFALTGVATVFFYARLWRRSGVMTDLEFYELRYSGTAAKAVRGFRSLYLGLFFNCLVIASVNLAACKIAGLVFGFSMWQTLAVGGLLSVIFAAQTGLWGVIIIDFVQLIIMTSAMIAAAWFALGAPEVGGLEAMVARLSVTPGPDGISYLNLLPDFTNHWDIAVAVFILPIAVQWWSVWYPGSEPGGGSFIAQRMLASKSERDSLGAVLFFNFLHYVMRPWPWILVALASILVYPTLEDIQLAFPDADPALINHDAAYPAMMRFLPSGFLGLMVGAFIAAHSSTITTLLNWGSSYLVHDFYQRFLRRNADDRHYVFVARVTTVGLFFLGCLLTAVLDSAKQTFDIMLQIGAGTGLIYLVRWFWWRVNAWCEISAMAASLAISILFLVLHQTGTAELSTHLKLLLTVGFTTVCWLAAAWLAPATDERVLIDFYRRVRPPGPGWRRVRKLAALDRAEAAPHPGDSIPLALAGWTLGCAAIWSALFALGNFFYGRHLTAAVLGSLFLITATALAHIVRILWRAPEEQE
jgi:SSS family solute:Na+ symporter